MMSDSDDAGPDESQTDSIEISHRSGHSLINVLSSKTQRLGTGANRVFKHSSEPSRSSQTPENHHETESNLHATHPEVLSPQAASDVEKKNVNQVPPVRWQKSDSTSGYSSAQDLTPENNAAEESEEPPISDLNTYSQSEEPPIPNVLRECVSENSMPSSHSRSDSPSNELSSPSSLQPPREVRHQHSGGEAANVELQVSESILSYSSQLPVGLLQQLSDEEISSADQQQSHSAPSSMQPTRQVHQQRSIDEYSSLPSTSNFISLDSANHPDDTESVTVLQESVEPYKDVAERILRYSLCGHSTCQDEKCRSGAKKVEALKVFLEETDIIYTTDRAFFFETALETLRAIKDHNDDCEEPKCKIPLCYFYKTRDLGEMPWKKQFQEIKKEYFFGDPVLKIPGPSVFRKLMSSINKEPEEGADFYNLTRIGDFGNSVIAVAGEDTSQHWWIKRAYIVHRDRMEQTTKVMERISLSQDTKPNILPQLWYIKLEDHLIYATPFMGTLLQKLKSHRGKGFLEEACWMLMKQMVDAAFFLHSNNILYLNWQCKNVVYDDASGIAQVTNFTNAVQLPVGDAEKEQDVISTLQEWMSAHLVPPEIYQSSNLDVKNDIWGMAALLYEMTTGSMIHERYHHEEPSVVREMLTDNPVVNLDKVQSTAIKQFLRRSLKVSWRDRLALENLKTLVDQNLSQCQQPSS